jgi:hypothetical protein
MDKRVDKGEDFKKSGMTLITEVDSERHLKRAARAKKENERIFDNQEEWADGFVGK